MRRDCQCFRRGDGSVDLHQQLAGRLHCSMIQHNNVSADVLLPINSIASKNSVHGLQFLIYAVPLSSDSNAALACLSPASLHDQFISIHKLVWLAEQMKLDAVCLCDHEVLESHGTRVFEFVTA